MAPTLAKRRRMEVPRILFLRVVQVEHAQIRTLARLPEHAEDFLGRYLVHMQFPLPRVGLRKIFYQ